MSTETEAPKKLLEMIDAIKTEVRAVGMPWIAKSYVLEHLEALETSLRAVIAEQKTRAIDHKPAPWVSSTATLINALHALAALPKGGTSDEEGIIHAFLLETAQRLADLHAKVEELSP